MPNIIIRTDTGGSHGMGHSVRMCALAKELEKHGAHVTFATTTHHALQNMTTLPCVHWVYDDDYILNADVYILDTKAWMQDDEDFIMTQKTKGKKVVWIDRQEVSPQSCDMVIAPNMHWQDRIVTKIYDDFGDNFLYGSGYTMLADELSKTLPSPYEKRIYGPVVFCAGGSDPTGALQRMYNWTSGMCLDYGILVFAHPETVKIQRASNRLTSSITMRFRRSLLRNASMVIGMFGVTPYECLYYQTPMLVMGHTEENVLGAEILAERSHGAIECMRHIDNMRPDVFRDVIVSYWENQSERLKMSHAAGMIGLDGKGVSRVAQVIMELK